MGSKMAESSEYRCAPVHSDEELIPKQVGRNSILSQELCTASCQFNVQSANEYHRKDDGEMTRDIVTQITIM